MERSSAFRMTQRWRAARVPQRRPPEAGPGAGGVDLAGGTGDQRIIACFRRLRRPLRDHGGPQLDRGPAHGDFRDDVYSNMEIKLSRALCLPSSYAASLA